ncbi:MAG: TonB family protein [Dyadobacter sp.]
MKQNFTLSLFFLFTGSLACFAQTDTIKLFYDKNWKVIRNPLEAEFSRVAFENDNGYWEVKDYFKTKKLQMEGFYLDKKLTKMQGPFVWYYESGQVKMKSQYRNNDQIDEHYEYYESGQLDTFQKFDNSGKVVERHLYKKDGSESIFTDAEFPGGTQEMYRFLGEHINYPKELRKKGLEGKVIVSFVVRKDGSLDNLHALSSPNSSFSWEAIRVIRQMPKWKPAYRDENAISIKYNLPVNFKLE